MTLKSKSKLGLGAVLLAFSLLTTEVSAHIPIPPKKGEIGRRETNVAAPSFTLTNQAGQEISSSMPMAARSYSSPSSTPPVQMFARCSAPTSPRFSAPSHEEKRENYLLLSISTDPKRDTPAKMKAYAEAFKADFKHWQFLTGSQKDLSEVWKNFGVNVKDHGNGQIQHTNLTTLIDAKGVRRVDYYGDKWLVKEVLKDIKWLESEKS